MAVRIENDCCDCATESYPCLGDQCKYRNVKHFYCDRCREEVDELYYGVSGMELCAECALKELEKVEG